MRMLRKPPRSLHQHALPIVEIEVSRLVRVSRRSTGEPYFGRTGANRFDDPGHPKAQRYGTCYCGLDLQVAMAETLLHDEVPVHGRFALAYSEFADRYRVRFDGTRLRLANLTGADLKAFAGDGSLSTIVPYDVPQQWSRAIHRHPDGVDGILYVSRHVNTKKAVVLFDRAQGKLGAASYVPLPQVKTALKVARSLHIAFDF